MEEREREGGGRGARRSDSTPSYPLLSTFTSTNQHCFPAICSINIYIYQEEHNRTRRRLIIMLEI
jgi:hypothetical protein